MSDATSMVKLRVAVLMGGKSIEREVSFNSGRTICDHLDTSLYDVVPIFQTHSGQLYLLPAHFLHRGKISDFFDRLEKEAKKIAWDELKNLVDFVYIALHGRFGEDGTVQGFLEVLKIAYLGAKVFGSALSMNKDVQKKLLQSAGIDVPNGITIAAHQVKKIKLDGVLKALRAQGVSLPCIIKPVHEGSSFGISVVEKEDELLCAIHDAAFCDPSRVQDVLVEEKLDGMEFVSVCLRPSRRHVVPPQDERGGWRGLAVTEVVTEEGAKFYDYVQKYMPGRAQKITPARCGKKDYENIINTCIKVSQILEFSTISRIDGFLTKDGRVVIIDPNTLTGMGPATFLFHQAAEAGMSHTQLINYLIDAELKGYGVVCRQDKDKNMTNVNTKKIKVAVLLGGNTHEREVSLESGRNVCYKLSPQKYDIIPIFINDDLRLFKLSQRLLVQNSTKEISDLVGKKDQVAWSDLPTICDFVFIGLHGGVGENGSIQGTLEMLGLPYNGSGVLTSALCMDKFKTAQFLKDHGFDVPRSLLLGRSEWQNQKDKQSFLESKMAGINYPFILKPHNDGCSVFVKKIDNKKRAVAKIDDYFNNTEKKQVLIEEFIKAVELTCGVTGNNTATALPPSQAVVRHEILSMEEKFLPGAGENLTPAPLPKKVLQLVQQTMEKAYAVLGCKGYARIDCFYQSAKESPTKKERVVILEVNTLPAMTPATCIFHQAAEVGVCPMEFVDKIVQRGFENHKKLGGLKDYNLNLSCVL